LVGRQEEHLARKKLSDGNTGMVICLDCGANALHMVQLMPLSLLSLASVKSRMVYLSGAGLPYLSWEKSR